MQRLQPPLSHHLPLANSVPGSSYLQRTHSSASSSPRPCHLLPWVMKATAPAPAPHNALPTVHRTWLPSCGPWPACATTRRPACWTPSPPTCQQLQQHLQRPCRHQCPTHSPLAVQLPLLLSRPAAVVAPPTGCCSWRLWRARAPSWTCGSGTPCGGSWRRRACRWAEERVGGRVQGHWKAVVRFKGQCSWCKGHGLALHTACMGCGPNEHVVMYLVAPSTQSKVLSIQGTGMGLWMMRQGRRRRLVFGKRSLNMWTARRGCSVPLRWLCHMGSHMRANRVPKDAEYNIILCVSTALQP